MDARVLRSIYQFIFLILTLAIFGLGYAFYQLNRSPLLSRDRSALVFEIKPQTTARGLANQMYAKGLIASPRLFQFLIRVQGLSHALKAGVYEIQPSETASGFLYRVVQGDVLIQSYTLVEGTALRDIQKQLKQIPLLQNHHPNIWQDLANDHLSPEGLLLAETYHYPAGSDVSVLLNHANQHLNQALAHAWAKRDRSLPYQSPYQLLIAASIIEKESKWPDERRLISAVIKNRLTKGMPLQMDPTVIYALGDLFQGKLTREDLKVDSPFNTYKYKGLPPTPIAMVGRDALDAAAHPANQPYVYFVAKGDGRHQFSVTYDEQKRAIKQYQHR